MYECESCGRDFGLLCLTPVGKGHVEILCGQCFGDRMFSGNDHDKKVYLPSTFMGDYKSMLDDNKVIFYNVIAW
jgi:hypothetical protein